MRMKQLQKKYLKALYMCENICNIQMKHLQTYVWKTRWNIWNIYLKHTCIATATCATFRSTFATSRWNTCNIQMKHLKHLKHTLAHGTRRASGAQTGWVDRVVGRAARAGLSGGRRPSVWMS
jgi:hypothetical protein